MRFLGPKNWFDGFLLGLMIALAEWLFSIVIPSISLNIYDILHYSLAFGVNTLTIIIIFSIAIPIIIGFWRQGKYQRQEKRQERLPFRIFRFALLILVIAAGSVLLFIGFISVTYYGGSCAPLYPFASTYPCSFQEYFSGNLLFGLGIFYYVLPPVIGVILLGIVVGLIQLIKKRNSKKLAAIRDDKNLSKNN